MASKRIDIQGFITDQNIQRTDHNGNTVNVNMTAHEVAQLIHASVDSSGIAKNQSLKELVVLYPSKVNGSYSYWNADQSTTLIPWTFGARGNKQEYDNIGVPFPNAFPTGPNDKGMTGFVRSFSTPLEAETIEISFTMGFEVAIIAP